MTCTTAVFTLMMGAIVLACAALYTYFNNLVAHFKAKLDSLNTALTSLQEERGVLIHKTEHLFLENATQSNEIERLNTEAHHHKQMIERLENDNRHLMGEYLILDNYLKEYIEIKQTSSARRG